jgi:2-haloacid dehalogenase
VKFAGIGAAEVALRGQGPARVAGSVKALVFDVFGTVVDWRGSIIEEGHAWGKTKGISVDWARFADQWRDGYMPSMNRVRKGEIPWTNLDRLHRAILENLLEEFNIEGLSEEEKDPLEPRLAPPKAVARLHRRPHTPQEEVHDRAAFERQRRAAHRHG